jgi:hypothetical protein
VLIVSPPLQTGKNTTSDDLSTGRFTHCNSHADTALRAEKKKENDPSGSRRERRKRIFQLG